jgi:hypothetical protein
VTKPTADGPRASERFGDRRRIQRDSHNLKGGLVFVFFLDLITRAGCAVASSGRIVLAGEGGGPSSGQNESRAADSSS